MIQTPRFHEFSIVACHKDGGQLTGSGYRGVEEMKRAVADRERFHFGGSSVLRCIVIVRDDGQTVTERPAIGRQDFELSNPADRHTFQQWYRDEDGQQRREYI